jgi:hypothetical protein
MSWEFNNYETKLKPICCGRCGRTPSNEEKLLRCSACRVIKYCNINCQREHWSQCHKKECKTLKRKMYFWEDKTKEQFEKANDTTDMWIMGTRLALGDNDDPINHELACKLYETATTVQTPIVGGHPVAMLHLALHYERGIGVQQSHTDAYRYYKSVIDHPFPGEENTCPAFVALSRYHKTGLVGDGDGDGDSDGGVVVEQSEELANKYLAFSESNPESANDIQGLETWWQTGGGREKMLKY